jgi:hypothetical protein
MRVLLVHAPRMTQQGETIFGEMLTTGHTSRLRHDRTALLPRPIAVPYWHAMIRRIQIVPQQQPVSRATRHSRQRQMSVRK